MKTSGATCTSSSECASSSCYAGVCQCSTSCVYDPASCAQGCSLPNTSLVLPAPFADYCGEKKVSGTCHGPNECLSGICYEGLCTLKPPGATCTDGSECASDICYMGVCECQPTACTYEPAGCGHGCSFFQTCIMADGRLYPSYCGVLQATGGTCRDRNECLSGTCSQGKCTSIPKLPGATCNLDSECASNSCWDSVCECFTSCVYEPVSCPQGCPLPNTCIVLPGPFSNECGVKKGKGGTCRGPNECLSGICSGGLCQLKSPGATCTSASECASNGCVAGVCQCSTSCMYNPTSCAQGCSFPSTCIVLPAPFASYCGEKQVIGRSCRGNNECQSNVCHDGRCTVITGLR